MNFHIYIESLLFSMYVLSLIILIWQHSQVGQTAQFLLLCAHIREECFLKTNFYANVYVCIQDFKLAKP